MNRRRVIACLVAGLVAAGPVLAQDIGADLAAQLRAQGFDVQVMETTWLGRLRILALRDGGQREIIVNPRTGEILRDVFTASSGTGGAGLLDPSRSTSGGRSGRASDDTGEESTGDRSGKGGSQDEDDAESDHGGSGKDEDRDDDEDDDSGSSGGSGKDEGRDDDGDDDDDDGDED